MPSFLSQLIVLFLVTSSTCPVASVTALDAGGELPTTATAALCPSPEEQCDDEETTMFLQLRSKDALALEALEASRNGTSTGIPTLADLDAAMEAFLELPREELRWKTLPSCNWWSRWNLDFKVVDLPTPFIGGSCKTRAFEDVPGPIMRVKPGRSLRFTLSNKLEPGPGNSTCGGPAGQFEGPNMTCRSNSTNIHTHGLHTSPEGNGDNIFLKLVPGESRRYNIRIPVDHMGGTHWYHSHLHHSTALHAGGGAHGMIIVEDPKGSLPKIVEEMPEIPIFMSLIEPLVLMRLEQWGLSSDGETTEGQQLWINSAYPDWRWANTPPDVDARNPIWFTVNGQYRPQVTVEEGKWYRLRFAKAAAEWHTTLVQNERNCEFKLLAKDGVYLHEAARPVERLYFGSGSRADVAVRCFVPESERAQATPYLSQLLFSSYEQRIPGRTPDNNQTGELLAFSILAAPKERWDADLEPFSVRRPCYLADLRNAPKADVQKNQHNITLANNVTQFAPLVIYMELWIDEVLHVWGHHLPEAALSLPVGELVEFNVTDGLHFHVLHLHVNPFQIQSMDSDGSEDPWYQVGDWQDTVYPTAANHFVVRQNLDLFTGRAVIHCHLLQHEDNGMMTFFNITGREGSRYPAKARIDPTCYEGPFPDKCYWGK